MPTISVLETPLSDFLDSFRNYILGSSLRACSIHATTKITHLGDASSRWCLVSFVASADMAGPMSSAEGEAKMSKLILATAPLFLRRPSPPTEETAHEVHHLRTRTRRATRRLRASRVHDPYFDLSPLDLSRRH